MAAVDLPAMAAATLNGDVLAALSSLRVLVAAWCWQADLAADYV